VLHHSGARVRRAIIDTLIALASVTVVLSILVAIDSRAGSELARMVKAPRTNSGVVLQARDETVNLFRSGWETAQTHAPLTTFVGVGAILVLFMLRMK
jgi:hypothetical protein